MPVSRHSIPSCCRAGGGRRSLHLARTNRPPRRAGDDRAGARSVGQSARLKYVNRLSDHLFVLARFVNDGGRADVLWQPGANR